MAAPLIIPINEDIRIKGVNVQIYGEANSNNIYENCDFGGNYGPQYGTYINCNNVTADGITITCFNCTILNLTSATINSRFINCSGNMTVTGDHINCIGYFYNDIGSNNVSYTNCVGSSGSFAGGNPVRTRGKVLYCRLTSGSFATVADGGIIRYSLNGSLSGVNSP